MGTDPRATHEAAVVIACYAEERWPQLEAAVESVRGQTLRPREVLVVVDHNAPLLRRAAERWPELTVVPNTGAQGASGARNTGALHTDARVVAFLDDDAVAAPEWLQRLLDALDTPGVVGVGGEADPMWSTTRPRWFPDEFLWVVGASPRTGTEDVPAGAHEVRNVWAQSMAVRKDAFVAVGGFRRDFGKVGSHSSPEDTDLCIRMTAHTGSRWLLVPHARIDHHVPAGRSTFRFFLLRCFYEGEGKAALRALLPAGSLGPERAYAAKTLPSAVRRGLRAAVLDADLAAARTTGAVVAGAAGAAAGYLWGAAAHRFARPSRDEAVQR